MLFRSLVKQCHWLRKRHDLKEKNGVIFELIALMRANDIARITADFKLDASRTCSPSKESLDCQTNSPCQYIGKCIKNSIENIHSEARV